MSGTMSTQSPEAEPIPQSRVARKRTKRMHEILQVAAEELAARGYHNVSLDDVAVRLDLTKASLYHYFDGKEALFAACLEMVAEEALRRLHELAAVETDPVSMLRALIVEDLRISTTDHPETTQLFLRPMDWPPAIHLQVREWRRRHDEIFAGAIDAGIAAGVLWSSDPYVARHCLHGALNYAPVWLRTAGRSKREAAIDSIADQMIAMLRPVAATP